MKQKHDADRLNDCIQYSTVPGLYYWTNQFHTKLDTQRCFVINVTLSYYYYLPSV